VDELSTLSPAAADAAAAVARTAGEGLEEVGARVEAAVSSLGGWYGIAHDGFAERVVELQQHLDVLAFTAAAGVTLIRDYARRLEMLKSRLAAVDSSIAEVQARVERIDDVTRFAADWAEFERWQSNRLAVLAEFDELSESFATRMFAVIDQVPNRPRRLGEHVDDAARTVVSAAADTAYLAGGWAWDMNGWTSMARQVPSALADSAQHPVQTLAGAVAWDDWAAGRYGAGGAALGMAFFSHINAGPVGKTLPEGHRLSKYFDADGEPITQSFDELLAGVDLEHSEAFFYAHTLARHVEVDDEFLKQRLQTGEVEEGVVRNAPTLASRWADAETAERLITQALRERHEELNKAIDKGDRGYVFTASAPADAGVIWKLDSSGRPVTVPVTKMRVVLGETRDGSWFVVTAYPDA